MGAAAVTPMGAGVLNVALSQYAQAYRNNAMVIGDIVAPRVPVEDRSFQYVIHDRAGARLTEQTLRAPGAVPQAIRWSFSTNPYICNSHALRAEIPNETEAYTLKLGFSSKAKSVEKIMDKLLLDREVAVANMALNAGNYPNLQAVSGTSMWDNYGGASHPIAVVDAAKLLIMQSGVKATDFLIAPPVFTALRNHPDVVARFQYHEGGAVTLDDLSQLFGVKTTIASAFVLNDDDVASWVLGGGTGAILLYSQPVTSQQDVSAAKTFTWTGAPGTSDGIGVIEFPDPQLDAKQTIESADWYYDIQATASTTAVPFTGLVATPTMAAIPPELEG